MDQNQTGGEWARMVSGRLYDPADQEIAKRHRTGLLRCDRFNRIALWRAKAKQRALEWLIPSAKGKNFEVFAPFYCEYGVNIHNRSCMLFTDTIFTLKTASAGTACKVSNFPALRKIPNHTISPTIMHTPEITIIFLFLLFFIHQSSSSYSLHQSLYKRLKSHAQKTNRVLTRLR